MAFFEDKKIEAVLYYVAERKSGKTPEHIVNTAKFKTFWKGQAPSSKALKKAILNLYSVKKKRLPPNIVEDWKNIHGTKIKSKIEKTKRVFKVNEIKAVEVLVSNGRITKDIGYDYLLSIIDDI